jgi:hypothetical protein
MKGVWRRRRQHGCWPDLVLASFILLGLVCRQDKSDARYVVKGCRYQKSLP